MSLMPVNSTHADYLENIEPWQRIRDVLAGDRAIKRAGETDRNLLSGRCAV